MNHLSSLEFALMIGAYSWVVLLLSSVLWKAIQEIRGKDKDKGRTWKY
jgi:hypothetical protein